MNGAHGFRSRNHPLIVSFFVLSQRDRIDPLQSLWEKTG